MKQRHSLGREALFYPSVAAGLSHTPPGKPQARGTSLGTTHLFHLKTGFRQLAFHLLPGKQSLQVLFCLLGLLLTGNAFATDWYVSPEGDDQTNTGQSAESAFRTIQKAADAAQAGDVVNVMAGTYREQVDVKSGVKFQADPGARVTLNGTEVLTGWTLESGSTYRTSAMNWDVDPKFGSNQLFEDQTMIELLRWPKQTAPDIIMPTNGIADKVERSSSDSTFIVLTDSDFNEGDGRWDGAQIWINLSRKGHDGQGWTGTVVSTSGNTITVNWRSKKMVFKDEPWGFGAGQEYFLFDPTPEGVRKAGINNMLAKGEWWKDKSTNTVYVKTRSEQAPGSTATGAHLIEAKKRHFGFWSSTPAKFGYTIEGFRFFACSVTTVPDPFIYRHNHPKETPGPLFAQDVTNVTLDNLDFTYPSHQTDMTGDWQSQHSRWTGVVLHGRNSVMRNSKIRYTATSALSLMGENLKVLNNEFESTNYFCSNAGTINSGYYLRDAEIGYNKMWNTTVMAIYVNYAKNSNPNVPDQFRIHHNRIWDFLRRSDDSGAIDGAVIDGQWARIDHNVIFNTTIDQDQFRYQKAALYFDYGDLPSPRTYSGRWTVDHNVIYNVQNPILLNEINEMNIFNNVLLSDEYNGKKYSIEGHSNETKDDGSTFGRNVRIINNIMSHPPNRDPSDPFGELRLSESHNNIMNAGIGSAVLESLFVDPSNPDMMARNYALKENSPAIDKGVRLGMYDEGIIEEPDLGAYEKGSDGSGEDTTPPPSPAVPWVTNRLEDRFTLNWPAVTDVGGGVAYYEISTPKGSPQIATRYPELPTITVRGLTQSTTYTFNLVAVDGMGLRSDPTSFSVTSGDRLADVTLPKTATAPAIDGKREAGIYTGPVSAVAKVVAEPAPTDAADHSADWTASWDDNNLYIHVRVNDDVRMVDSERWYDDDNVEIFLNGNGERPERFGATDYQLYIRPGGPLEQWKDGKVQAPPAGAEGIAPNAAGSSTNYTAEVKIPFTALGITSSAELRFIGIEVNVGDDDTGLRPFGKLAWKQAAYQGPFTFSQAQLIPRLFDRTDPAGSGVVSAAGEDDGNLARNAFDNQSETKWLHKENTSWIEFKFAADGSTKYAVNRYSITSANDEPTRDPKDWKLYATNAENPQSLEDFVEVDSRSGVGFADRGEKRGYTANPPAAYSTYRLVITENSGAPWTQLAEVELFSPEENLPLTVIPTTARLVVGAAPQQLSANQAVIWSSSDEHIVRVSTNGVATGLATGKATITARSSVDTSKVATVSVAVATPSFDRTDPVGTGLVSAAGEDDGNVARNAFDNKRSTKWFHKANTTWLQFKFAADGATRYAVSKYTIRSANDEKGRDPKNWTLYGSNESQAEFPKDFVAVDRRSGVTFSARDEKQEFMIEDNDIEYGTYRLVITENNGAPWTQLSEVELFAPGSNTAKPILTLTPTVATIKLGEQQTLRAVISPVEYSSEVEWSSSDENVATVNSDGVVTAVGVGRASITARSEQDNTLLATAVIRAVELPALLSDRTDPVGSGVVLAAGDNDGHVGRNAFDNKPDTKWFHKEKTTWLQFQFDGGAKYSVATYTITSANDEPQRDPRDWTLYGSNVAQGEFPRDFVEVDRQSGVTFSSRFQKQEFIISPLPAAYSTYRLVITNTNGAPWMQLAEVELFAPDAPIIVTGLTATNSTATSFTLSWNAAGGKTAGYEIFKDNVSIGTTADTTFQVNSLLPGTTYQMTVKARDAAGNNLSNAGAVLAVTTSRSGAVIREFWANVAGTSVSNIPVNKAPTSLSAITSLEDPTPSSSDDAYNNFGQRIRGYIIPSANATYYFYIASDNNGEFWLSSDDQPVNKGTAPIAKLNGSTGKREWTKDLANQKSAGMDLVAGRKYYFEALMKESGGNNNLAIGWTTATNDTGITVIGSSNLEAYVPGNGVASVTTPACNNCRSSAEVREDFTLKLRPNPASSDVNISLAGFEAESAVQVRMTDMSGKLFVTEQVQLRDGIQHVILPVSHLPQGLFLVRVQGSKTVKTAKLVITK